jgi:transposase-like protein
MEQTYTIQNFFRQFPNDDACLAHVMETRYGKRFECPKCGKNATFHKRSKRPAYECSNCGHDINPMVGTPFERTRTPLQKWFYAMYLFTTSRHGVPAKELQRQLGVTYKTAWRMGHELRKYMGKIDGDDPLDGHVELDETYIGGKRSGGKRGRGAPGKTIVFGMLERNGDVMTKVVPNVRKTTLEPHIVENVMPRSTVSTDELRSYSKISRLGYDHGTVNHSAEEWVNGIHHVNGLEGFWSRVKNSIRGTHIHVSKKHLSKYPGEFEFRYNLRHAPETMFSKLLLSL